MTAEPDARERELKLTLDDPGDEARIVPFLRSQGYEISFDAEVRNDDLYLDTLGWDLFKSGLSLRFRRAGGRQSYTMKSIGPLKEGLADRFELEVAAPRETFDPTDIPVESVRSRVNGVIGTRKLTEHVMIQTDRRIYTLAGARDTRIELAFDSTAFQARGAHASGAVPRLCEMEAELLGGDAGELERISRLVTGRFSCRPSRTSKFETAVRRFQLKIPE